MWNANFVAQTPSVHSTPRSVSFSSHRGSDYDSDRSSETIGDGDLTNQNGTVPLLWQHRQDRLAQKLGNSTTTPVAEMHPQTLDVQLPKLGDINNAESRSESRASTRGGEQAYEYPEKTPTMLEPRRHLESDVDYPDSEYNDEPPRVVGPLEQQLSALMSKIVFMESENPTVSVSPEEYQSLQDRVKTLEAENQRWKERYEAIFALRDEDVANLVKVRGLLAEERHKHAEMRKLRDDDIGNVIKVRGKLADATRKLDELEKTGGSTPKRPRSVTIERKNTADLFQAAKTAALEQRALELEKANEDLVRQLTSAGSGVKSDGEVAQLQNTIHNLKARLNQKEGDLFGASNPRSMANNNNNVVTADWNRIQAMLEENARYREKMGGRVQQLRAEKETLQKELNRKDDENADLEARLERFEQEAAAGSGRGNGFLR